MTCLAAAGPQLLLAGQPAKLQSAATDTKEREGIVRSDLSRCLPGGALSRSFEKNRWQLIDYESVDGVKGTMASAKPEDLCQELTLPLEATGLHRIDLGINYTKAPYPEWPASGQLEVKLTGETAFRRVAAECGSESQEIYKAIYEAYWKTADMTGKSLLFRQPETGRSNISNLSYVRLVPLSQQEEREWRESWPTETTRKLAVLFCTGMMSGGTSGGAMFHPTNQQWFEDQFAPFAASDFKLFVFEALRGNYCLYHTKIGDVGTEDNRWQDDWIDPLASFTQLAHSHGLKICASLRMVGPQYPTNRSPIAWARHYWKHPEWTKLDRKGIPVSNWSLAYAGARQYWLSLLRETLEYGTDGIQLHLNRSTPFVLYEEPVVRSFQEQHGEDPRKLPADDPRWLAHCAGYLTRFVREVRALVDEKPGRQLGVTVYGENPKNSRDPDLQLKHCVCDVETWLRERLVDYVMPSPYIDVSLLKAWRALAGDRVHLWPDLMPRIQPPEGYVRLAKRYYDAGADGLCLWDGDCRPPHISQWAVVQTLGHKHLLNRLVRECPSYHRRIPLKMLGGFSVQDSSRDG